MTTPQMRPVTNPLKKTTDPRLLLREVVYFEDLSDECLDLLSRGSRVQHYPVGTLLFSQGDPADFLYIALEGSFELFTTTTDGVETIIEISSAPRAYTLGAVLTNAPYIVSGRVIQKATVLMIDGETLSRCVVAYPRLGQELLGAISWQYRQMVRQIVNLKTKSAAERLGCYLLDLMRSTGNEHEIVMPYSKRRLAARLGMTTVSLSRAYKTLSKHGVLPMRDRVVVSSVDKLVEFARPNEFASETERDLRFRGIDRIA